MTLNHSGRWAIDEHGVLKNIRVTTGGAARASNLMVWSEE